ncbi:MAG: 30S ribosomal protein S2 [Candidatus Micrarchaeia archaeon]|jgi:small subunit ribosomal protein S2
MADMLLPQEKYLESGIHIGTKTKNGGMRAFIYKAREDGLHVLDLKKMDERMRLAAGMLASYDPEIVYIIGSKDNAFGPINKMCEMTGFNGLNNRFTPGRFTNPERADFVEPALIFVTDPGVDKQAVKEANVINVPVIALCDTNNSTRYVDLVIPANNKGKKAIALAFWLITREVLKLKGVISSYDEFKELPSDFE